MDQLSFGGLPDEADFAHFISKTVDGLPEMDQIVILADQPIFICPKRWYAG
ncbi:MAG: hypothetical protein R3B93_14390 [Bacteroidia bacterium]